MTNHYVVALTILVPPKISIPLTISIKFEDHYLCTTDYTYLQLIFSLSDSSFPFVVLKHLRTNAYDAYVELINFQNTAQKSDFDTYHSPQIFQK